MGSRERRARRGQPSILERGWQETDPTGKGNGLTWTIESPIGTYLTMRGVGLSQREACLQSGVNRSTIRNLLETAKLWIPEGGDLTPEAIRAISDDHARRSVAFYAEEERRRGEPKAVGLLAIMQAAQGGDWRAGRELLKLLYRDEFGDRIQHVGEGGGPIEVDAPLVAEKLRTMLKNLVDARLDDEAAEVNLPAEVNLGEDRATAVVSFPSGEAATPGQQAAAEA